MGEKGIYGKYRKAQITVPIIIGIIIVVIVALALLANQLRQAGTLAGFLQQENADTAAVRAFVEACIRTETQGAVRAMAAQGGFLFITRERISLGGVEIPIAYEDGKNLLPSRREMSDQLALYLNTQIASCANFTEFKNRGIDIKQEPVDASVIIAEPKITVDVRFPLQITKADTRQVLNRFIHEEQIGLGAAHAAAVEIVEHIIDAPDTVDYLFLDSLGYNITFFPFNLSTMVYTVTEPIGQFPLLFQFATVHIVQVPPFFEAPESIQVIDDKPFFVDFEATDPNGGVEGEDLIFSDDAAAFDVLSDGKLLFRPTITGPFDATITVTDPTGLSFSRTITFEVQENN